MARHPQQDMINEELDKILQEVTQNASKSDKFIVRQILSIMILLLSNFPLNCLRMAFEILYRTTAVVEGLDKK